MHVTRERVRGEEEVQPTITCTIWTYSRGHGKPIFLHSEGILLFLSFPFIHRKCFPHIFVCAEKAGVLKQYNEGIEVIKLDITALNNKL